MYVRTSLVPGSSGVSGRKEEGGAYAYHDGGHEEPSTVSAAVVARESTAVSCRVLPPVDMNQVMRVYIVVTDNPLEQIK